MSKLQGSSSNLTKVKKNGNEWLCDCEGWKNGWPSFRDAVFVAEMKAGWQYIGTTWEFCPWCGERFVVNS